MISRVHVNQYHIKANAKGKNKPVFTVKTYKENVKGNKVVIKDKAGTVVATFVYSPDKPLSCGAKVWLETELTVDVAP
jgi:hypothetical protein